MTMLRPTGKPLEIAIKTIPGLTKQDFKRAYTKKRRDYTETIELINESKGVLPRYTNEQDHDLSARRLAFQRT